MSWSTRWAFRHGIAWMGAWLLVGFAASQPSDPRLEKIFADWRKRQERMGTVFYHLSGSRVTMKGSSYHPPIVMKKDVPPRDITATFKRSLLLDFVEGRYRLEMEDQSYDIDADRLHPSMETRVFDGKQIKAFRPREKNTHPHSGVRASEPEIGVGNGYFGGAVMEVNHWPLFVAHGSIPGGHKSIRPGELKVLPAPDLPMCIASPSITASHVGLCGRTLLDVIASTSGG